MGPSGAQPVPVLNFRVPVWMQAGLKGHSRGGGALVQGKGAAGTDAHHSLITFKRPPGTAKFTVPWAFCSFDIQAPESVHCQQGCHDPLKEGFVWVSICLGPSPCPTLQSITLFPVHCGKQWSPCARGQVKWK